MKAVNWELQHNHAHFVGMMTGETEGHRHYTDLFVFPVGGSSYDEHVHYYRGFTEITLGHAHRFYDYTGPAIPLPDGTHYHVLEGETYYNYTSPISVQFQGKNYIEGVQYNPGQKNVHRHSYFGYTGGPIGYPPADW